MSFEDTLYAGQAESPTPTSGVSVIGPLDVSAMRLSGEVAITGTSSDIGSVAELFDGQTASLYRSANINPAAITAHFTVAQTFREFGVYCSHTFGNPAYRWMIETADTLSDLDGRSGSFQLAVPWTGTPSDQWSNVSLPFAITAKFVRLTVQRLTGDNYVHINEWVIHAESVVTTVDVSPMNATILQGQTLQFAASGTTTTSGTIDLAGHVTWDSTAPLVATVTTSGLATGTSAGSAGIRATLEALQGQGTLTVEADETDLNVTFVERTPRYNYDAFKNNPAPGDVVTFTAHVRLRGDATLLSATYRWELDGTEVTSGVIANFVAGSERTVSLPWIWQSGNHNIAFHIDPDNVVSEASESNNAITDRVNSIIAGFWVEQSMYDYFNAKQRDLQIGSNSWEDWIQRQMSKQNELYANAIYPSSPQGALDRVRIDKIVIVPDGALPLNGGLPTNHPDTRDKTVDLMWGFPSSQLDSTFYADTTSTDLNNPFFLEQSLIHELGHARYLIDCYGFDVHNTYDPKSGQGHNSVQILENGLPVAGTPLMPFLAFDQVLYYNKSGGVMSGPFGFVWSPYEAAALNLIAGRRALCGNYNAPCNIGAYINDLPQNNLVLFVDQESRPLRGADVRIYRADGGPGWYGKTIDGTPDLFFTTDVHGYAHLPRNPFSSGPVQHTFGIANGVAVLRIEHASGLWYRFLEISDFNMQFWAGNTGDAECTIALAGATGCHPADLDCDSDVDPDDFGEFHTCIIGPATGPQSVPCDVADIDGDNDVDLADAQLFLLGFTGSF